MLRDLFHHSAIPGAFGLAFATGAALAALDHPIITTIAGGVAVSLIVAHVLAVFRLFKRIDRAEAALDLLRDDRDRSEQRMERVADELLRTLVRMDEKLDTQSGDLATVKEKVVYAEGEIGKLRAFQERMMDRLR